MKYKLRIKSAIVIIFFNSISVYAQDFLTVVKNGELSEIKQYIETNPEILQQKDQNDLTPLHISAYYGHLDISEYFIQKGADINTQSDQGLTPLHYAIYNENVEIVKLLVKKGADLNIKCIRGRTPLIHNARETGNVEIGKILIENGADINARDNNNRTPLYFSTYRGYSEFVRFLLNKDVNVPMEGEEADNLFQNAAIGGHKELFEYMINNGITVNSDKKNYLGGTILHSAASGGLAESINSLIQSGLNINEECRYGLKPIHYATIEGHLDVLEILIKEGADVNTLTKSGKTPLDYAIESKNKQIIDFLILKGANQDSREFSTFTGKFFGQKSPENKAEIFAAGIISSPFSVHSSVAFTPDGNEVYWTRMVDMPGIYSSKLINNQWTFPEVVISPDYSCYNPTFSPDGRKMFFKSYRPIEEKGENKMRNWYVERNGGIWSEPKLITEKVNNSSPDWQVSIDNQSNIYFSSSRLNGLGLSDIYVSEYLKGEYIEPKNLGKSINTEYEDNSPFISKNAEYIVFVSNRPGGVGGYDIYVSFKNKDGLWEEAINLGNKVNSEKNELWPTISPNGKYLFFASIRNGNMEVFWIETKIINSINSEL